MSARLLLAGSLFVLVVGISPATGARADVQHNSNEFDILNRLNADRAAAGLRPLSMASQMHSQARSWSSQEAANDGPFADYPFLSSDVPSPCSAAAANEYWGPADDAEVESGFMGSPPHRANNLGPYNYVGIGMAVQSNGMAYVSEVFCQSSRPLPVDMPPCPGGSLLGSLLNQNVSILRNVRLQSPNGRYRLVFQCDENLVLYGGRALWATATNNRYGARVVMQGDGNLVMYGTDGTPKWASHTEGHPGARLVVQDDGNLVIYRGSQALWSTATNGRF